MARLLVAALLLTSVAAPSVRRQDNGTLSRLRYKCQSPYRRIGNRCYFMSREKLPWRDSQFACSDLNNGYLAKLDKNWKDRKLRNFLNRSKDVHERWIGSIYDDRSHKWIWAKGGEALRYQGFSLRKPHDNYRWRCVIMNPSQYFRWSTRSCLSKKYYVCEIPIDIIAGRKENQRVKNLKRGRKKMTGHRNKYLTQLDTNNLI